MFPRADIQIPGTVSEYVKSSQYGDHRLVHQHYWALQARGCTAPTWWWNGQSAALRHRFKIQEDLATWGLAMASLHKNNLLMFCPHNLGRVYFTSWLQQWISDPCLATRERLHVLTTGKLCHLNCIKWSDILGFSPRGIRKRALSVASHKCHLKIHSLKATLATCHPMGKAYQRERSEEENKLKWEILKHVYTVLPETSK